MSTPRCVELDEDKLIALDDLVEVLHSEHAHSLILGHLGPQAKRGDSKQTDQTLHLALVCGQVDLQVKTHSSFHLLPVASETRRLEIVTGSQIGGGRKCVLCGWLFLPLFCLLVGRDPVCVRLPFEERVALSPEPVRIREEPLSAENPSSFARKSCYTFVTQTPNQTQAPVAQYYWEGLFPTGSVFI